MDGQIYRAYILGQSSTGLLDTFKGSPIIIGRLLGQAPSGIDMNSYKGAKLVRAYLVRENVNIADYKGAEVVQLYVVGQATSGIDTSTFKGHEIVNLYLVDSLTPAPIPPVVDTTRYVVDSFGVQVADSLGAWVIQPLTVLPVVPTVPVEGIDPAYFTVSSDGGWCWFADPRALYYNGKTYFGFINSVGSIIVKDYVNATETISAETILHSALEVDDHDNPSFLIRDSDKRILSFYSKHAGNAMYKRVSTNPEDTSAWDGEVSLPLGSTNYTYPTPVQTTGEALTPIRLFYRKISTPPHNMCYNRSDDGGATWSIQIPLTAFTYFKIENTSTKIHFVCSNHPDDAVDHGLYHFYLDTAIPRWCKSDGTDMGGGGIIFNASHMTQVYDGSVTKGWVWDLALDALGKPVIVFDKIVSVNEHRYMYARWTGAAWDVHEICNGGGYIDDVHPVPPNPNGWYAGGVVLDHTDPQIVYCSRQIGAAWEIYKYVTADGGTTFTETAITSGSTWKNIRPVVVRNYTAGLKVLWLYGRFTSYVDYDLAVVGSAV